MAGGDFISPVAFLRFRGVIFVFFYYSLLHCFAVCSLSSFFLSFSSLTLVRVYFIYIFFSPFFLSLFLFTDARSCILYIYIFLLRLVPVFFFSYSICPFIYCLVLVFCDEKMMAMMIISRLCPRSQKRCFAYKLETIYLVQNPSLAVLTHPELRSRPRSFEMDIKT